ncbi:MAG TPA: S41 family peptidase, partial [Bacteroidia bacterium]|nr:S41 family peptidase [Bacteroidia bacterium]
NYKPTINLADKKLNKYQYDFEYLATLCEITFPNIDSIFVKEDRIKLRQEIIQKLSNPNTNNLIFLVQSRRYLSKFHSQHTNINLGSEINNIFPFILFPSDNKWFLWSIDKNVADTATIGKQVIAVNDKPIEEIIEQLKLISFGENDIGNTHYIENYQLYNDPEILLELDIIQQKDSIKLTFDNQKTATLNSFTQRDGYKRLYKISLKPNPVTKYSNKSYSYNISKVENFGYIQFNECYDKVAILGGLDYYVKPIMRPIAKVFLKRQFQKKKPSKLLANMYNPEYPVFGDFLNEFFTKIKEQNIDTLVIDLRNNSGGDFNLCLQLMYYITDKTNLKDFTEYIYTSEVYKSYSRKEYKEFATSYQQKYNIQPPQNQLILKGNRNGKISLFDEITNPKSIYYVKPSRPVFNGVVFVLANTNTGSSAALLTTLIQDNGLATVIGTSVGNNPTGATVYSPFILPKTKANVSISSSYLERPDKFKGKIQIPDIWIERTMTDWIKGKDPLFENAIKN